MMDDESEPQDDGSPPDPNPAEWYYLKDGRPLGPVAESSIRAWLESGFLRPGDYLWRRGLADWLAADQLPEFAGAGGRPGPPPPPVTLPGGPPGSRAPVPGSLPGPEGRPVTIVLPRDPSGTPRAVLMAGFWLRAGAAMIDWMLLSLVLFLVFRPEIPEANSVEEMRRVMESMQADRKLLAFSIVLPWLYFAVLESSPWQATLGKKAFRLRVITVGAERLGPLRATLRHLAKVVLMDLTFLLSFLPAAFTARKQALHDLVAGTLVVRE